jgi:hypothetical protein
VSVSPALRWAARSASVRGEEHVRRQLPNQDAVRVVASDSGTTAIACIADGHGSARSFRSEIGARIAVDVAFDALIDFRRGHATSTPGDVTAAADMLPASIGGEWAARIRAEVDRDPLPTSATVSTGQVAHPNDALLAYGSTVVGALVTPEWRVLLQLGDGDLVHCRRGSPPSRPLGLGGIGIETSSLATLDSAARDFVVRTLPAPTDANPELLLLATDGYANSFAEDAGFLAVASDLWDLIERNGLDWVAEQLPAWLRTASANGSGDDISVALLVGLPT